MNRHPLTGHVFALLGIVTVTACTVTSSNADDPYSPECEHDCLTQDGKPREPGADPITGENPGGSSSGGSSGGPALATNGQKDGDETDVDCGGSSGKKCAEGKSCNEDTDCDVSCSYAKKCIDTPSCKPHLGGDTCGEGEVEEGANGEYCCKTLPVAGFSDPAHPGKQVYLDKYEITAGRVRAWIEAMTKESGGEPNVKAWIAAHKPAIWDDAWNDFLPEGYEGPSKVIARRLLGDPRPEDNGWGIGPGVVIPPPTDEPRNMGVNYQFNSETYVDLHGMNCGVWDDTYGWPTYYYPPDILARNSQLPRADGKTNSGQTIPAKDFLDTKAMNCITNAMLAAFCAWDGGQLATDEVLDYVTKSPATYGYVVSGCGSQYDNHGDLLKSPPDYSRTVQSGGTCADVKLINATFDAGDALPEPNSPLNEHHYWYPWLTSPTGGNVTHDKSSQIAAPGRASTAPAAGGKAVDAIALAPGAEPWMDLAGNLSEAALDMNNGTFTGTFTLKLRGIGYGSSRSDLNVKEVKGETIKRVQRPEAKAAYIGGRCMRFK